MQANRNQPGDTAPSPSRQPRPLRADAVKLLALDIDDTLTGHDGRISPANLAAIAAARREGLLVTVVTGRRYRWSAERFAADIGLRGLLGCHYGRAIVEYPSGKVVRADHVPPGLCSRVLDYAEEYRLTPSLCVDEVFFFGPGAAGVTVEGRSLPGMETGSDLRTVLAERGARVMSIAVSGAGADGLRSELAAETAAGQVAVYAQRMSGRPESLAVVLSARSDKGTALGELCARLEIVPADALAMGDSEADIPLLAAAGYGIAMPWADQAVRAAADKVARGEPADAAANEILELIAARQSMFT